MTAENNPSNLKSPVPALRKKRRLLKIVAAVVLVIVVLIAMGPTLLSTSPVVAIVTGQINKQLNGKIEVGSLSLGWFTGIKLNGVKLFDDTNAQIAELGSAQVPLPLWKAVTGNFALGTVVIDNVSFDARYDADGQLNFSKLTKNKAERPISPSPAALKDESKPSRLPNISGDIKLTNFHGTVSQPGKPAVYLTQFNGEVKIPDINQPITNQFSAAIKVGDEPEGQITSSGTAAVIKANVVAVDDAEIHQIVDVQNLSLTAGKPFLAANLVNQLQGLLGAHLAIDLTNGKTAQVDVSVTGTNVSAGGKILKGDTYSTAAFAAAIPKLSGEFPNGISKWQTGRIKVGADAGTSPILLQTDQGKLSVVIDAMPQALLNLMANNKPGSTGQIVLADGFDLGAIARQLPHVVNVSSGVTVTSGTLSQNVTTQWMDEKATLSAVTDVTNIKGQRVAAAGTQALSIDPIHVSIAGEDFGGGGALPDLRNLKLILQSKFANGDFEGASLADLKGNFHADLKTLQEQLSQVITLQGTTMAGTVDANITNSGQLTAAPYQSALDVDVQGHHLKFVPTAGGGLDQPWMQLKLTSELHGSASSTLESVHNLAVTLNSGDSAAPTADVKFIAPAISLVNGISTHWQLDIPNIKHTLALMDTGKTANTTAKPLVFDSGSATLSGDIARSSESTTATSNIATQNIAFHRGDISYTAKPIAIKISAAISTVAGQPTTAEVTGLTGDLGIATLSMTAPIKVILTVNPIANGGINLVGKLADLTQLLTAVQGEKSDALPYRGNYTLNENITTQQLTVALKGGLDVAGFQSFTGNNITFSEDLLSIANDVSLTTNIDDAAINITSLTAAMKSSGALNLSLTSGSVQNLFTARTIQLQPKLDYDLAKLWPIVEPMMGDKYKTLKITGHYQKQFNVTGSYPANQPSTVAIKTVNADGDISVESFDFDGLQLQNFIVPFTLANGQLVTIYANKPAGQNTAAPASANGGTLDLSNLTIDLTQNPPALSLPAGKVVINNLTINPLFTGTFLAKVVNNPLFDGAKDASGLLDFTIDDCTHLPLGDLVTEPANTGKADLRLSLVKLHIGLANDSLQKYLKQNSFEANVNDATVAVAKGISTQHIKFVTGDYTLGFDGSVRLKDQAFIPMTVSFPLAAIATKTHLVRDPNIAKYLPNTLDVPVEGTVHNPKYRFDKTIPKAIADATAKGFIGGKGGNGLGGLLKQLGR